MKAFRPDERTTPIQEKFLATRRELAAALIERDEEIDVVLTALVCQEHPLLVGVPGTAKSLLLDSVMNWMNGQKFTILFTKFTTPEEAFGPISVVGLKEDRYRRVTTGKLPQADGAFGDEIFKASSAILNTLLRILNERVYDNGDGALVKVPLKIFVAASAGFGEDTRESTLERAAERIKQTRFKVEAYSAYLMEEKGRLERDLAIASSKLRAKVESLAAPALAGVS